jgi:hypothetical protein
VAVVGYFSTSPAYRYLEPEQGLLRLSFKHPGKIAAGPHKLHVQFNDDVRVQGFNYERAAEVVVRPGQVVLIDFNPEQGGVVIR